MVRKKRLDAPCLWGVGFALLGVLIVAFWLRL
jgi:hypothetical protein